jgi:hypothetical protein
MSRAQVNALASFEFATDIEAYAEMFYVDTRNAFQQAPQSGGLNTPGVDPAAFVVPDYGHNPILLAPVRQFFISNPQLFDPDGVYNNDPAHPNSTPRMFRGRGVVVRKPDRGTMTTNAPRKHDCWCSWRVRAVRKSVALGRFFQYQRSRTDQLTEGVYSQTRRARRRRRDRCAG